MTLQLHTLVKGSGKMIKTYIMNLGPVALSLGCHPDLLLRDLGELVRANVNLRGGYICGNHGADVLNAFAAQVRAIMNTGEKLIETEDL